MPYEGVLRSLGHDITSEQQHLLGEIRETFPSITEKSEILNFLLNAGKREKPECLIGALGEAAIECKGLNPRDRANSKKRMSVLAKHWEQFK